MNRLDRIKKKTNLRLDSSMRPCPAWADIEVLKLSAVKRTRFAFDSAAQLIRNDPSTSGLVGLVVIIIFTFNGHYVQTAKLLACVRVCERESSGQRCVKRTRLEPPWPFTTFNETVLAKPVKRRPVKAKFWKQPCFKICVTIPANLSIVYLLFFISNQFQE